MLKYSFLTYAVSFLICLFHLNISLGQMPDWTWAKTIKGRTSESSRCIAMDNQGNTYVAGVFMSDTLHFDNSSVLHSISPTGWSNDDIFIAKYGPTGNVLWARAYGGSFYESVYGLAIDSQGNIYLAGSFGSLGLDFGTFELTNSNLAVEGSPDAFLVKFNNDGIALWGHAFGGNTTNQGDNIEQCFAVAVDANDNVAIAGVFSSPVMRIQADTLIKMGLMDAFVAKFNSSGNVLWAKNFGGSFVDDAQDCKFDHEGNLYVTGTFTSSVFNIAGQTLNNSMGNSNDFYLIKLNPSGNVIWSRKADGFGQDFGNKLAVGSDGSAYVQGSFASFTLNFGNTSIASSGDADVFVVKYDANGNALWAKSIGDNLPDWGNAIAVDALGDVYCTGYFSSGSMYFGETLGYVINQGEGDGFLVKITSSGEFEWVKGIGTAKDDRGIALAYSPAGAIVITGFFSDANLNLGNLTLQNTPYDVDWYLTEIFLATFPAPTPLQIQSLSDVGFQLFPNPTNGECFLVLGEGNRDAEVMIFDSLGKLKMSLRSAEEKLTLSTKDFTPGIYYVSVVNHLGQLSSKRLSVIK